MAHTSNLQPFLDRLTSRSVLTEHEQHEVLILPVRVKQARTNEDFVSIGEAVDHASYVVDGLVGTFEQNQHGGRQITALHIRGEMPDLHSVVQPNATSAMQALSTTTLLQVPHSALRQAAAKHPAIAEAFWRDCMADSMVLGQWVVNIGRRDAQSRVAHLLCEMACRYRVADVGGRIAFQLSMTQAQLADATGLTPVHINRTLKKLEAIGTTFRGRSVRIEDWEKLVAIGDFDPGYLQQARPEKRFRIYR